MGRLICLASLSLLLVGSVGCDDEEQDCSYVATPCEAVGDHQCSSDGRTTQTCGLNIEGCYHWIDSRDCTSNQICSAEGGEPACVCDNHCDSEGASQCDGDIVQTCISDGDGCLFWGDVRDCSDDGFACVIQGDDASCETCSDQCMPAGSSRCQDSTIQICSPGGSGCLVWTDGTNCGDDGEVCEESGGVAVCVRGCDDECEVEDDTQCDGETIEVCSLDIDGCRYWVEQTDCAEETPPLFCDDTDEPALCAAECVNHCTTEGVAQCDDDVIESCEMQGSGCLDWEALEDCSVTADYCDADGEDAICLTCENDCEVSSATQCNGNVAEACTSDEHGCLSWETNIDCSTVGMVCETSGGEATCIEHCTPTGSEDTAASCSDGIDNDCNTFTDCDDFNCFAFCCVPSGDERGDDDCSDGVDNNCDGFADCGSYSCSLDVLVTVCDEHETACSDGLDNDGDGDPDCDDRDCRWIMGSTCSCLECSDTACSDGIDNDGNGFEDCEDWDCSFNYNVSETVCPWPI